MTTVDRFGKEREDGGRVRSWERIEKSMSDHVLCCRCTYV